LITTELLSRPFAARRMVAGEDFLRLPMKE
jgi:hypothetical protein